MSSAAYAIFKSNDHNPMRGKNELIWEGDDFTEWNTRLLLLRDSLPKGEYLHATDYRLFGGGIRTYGS